MKILYIAMKYEYGKQELGYSFEHYNFYDSLVEMNGRSNEIIYFSLIKNYWELSKKRNQTYVSFFFLEMRLKKR